MLSSTKNEFIFLTSLTKQVASNLIAKKDDHQEVK